MIYRSKYEDTLKMLLLYLVEYVGMEECSLDFLIRERPFVFLVGGGAGFYQQLKLECFNKVKAF